MSSRKHAAHIDGLRAVAVLPVVAYHAFPRLAPGGFAGVDVFFVISGYLITGLLVQELGQTGGLSLIQFYARRARRIFPALGVVLVSALAIGALILRADEFASLGSHVLASIGFVENFSLLKESGYFDIAAEEKPLLHLWSLAVEEQYYLAYPLLVLLAYRARWPLTRVVGGLAAASFTACIVTQYRAGASAFYLPHTRVWEILAGAWLSVKLGPLNFSLPQRRADYLGWVGAALLATAFFGLDKRLPHPGLLTLIPVAGAALLIAAGPNAITGRALSWPPAVFVGLISYPLYLWHWPLLSFARIVDGTVPSAALRIELVTLSAGLAVITFYAVERRLWRAWPTLRGAALAANGLLGVAVAAWFVHADAGVPERASENKTSHIHIGQDYNWNTLADRSCNAAFPAFKGTFCHFSGGRRPTVIVIGDSHANALFPGLEEGLAVREAVAVLAQAQCAPNLAIRSPLDKSRTCVQMLAPAMDAALSEPSVKAVVVASMGPLYFTGEHLGDAVREAWGFLDLAPVRRAQERRREMLFRTALLQTFSQLSRSGKRAVYVIDVPENDFSPSACIADRPYLMRGRATCEAPRREYDERTRRYRQMVEEARARYPSVRVVDGAAAFCSQTACRAEIGGVLMYRDNDHLSLAGSRVLASRIIPELAP